MNHEEGDCKIGNFKLKFQKAVCDRLTLSEIFRNMEIVEKQLEVPGLSPVSRVLLMHQVMVWELMKVLFSERQMPRQLKYVEDDHEKDMMPDEGETLHLEVLPLIQRVNRMHFNFIRKNRVRLLQVLSGEPEKKKVLSGDIQGSLRDVNIDWKRLVGLLMWFNLPPDTSLPVNFRTYQVLLNTGKATFPVPVYIDEDPEEVFELPCGGQRCDLAYYLMLLHSNEQLKFDSLKNMFTSFPSTNDPLDYHAIWRQRAVLEAVGAFSANDLHALDMGLVSQLLCLVQCHWAIYLVLHIPYREDYPYLHATLIREILFQYCEDWSGKHDEIWQLAVSREDHKSEIEDWDLRARLYLGFYELKSSLQENEDAMNELETLETKMTDARTSSVA